VSARPASVLPERPAFFATPAAWRAWLARHHATESVLWVGFRKKATGLPSITYPEALDGALCFGWIDGVRRSLGATSYTIRFTPRKARSAWSEVNTKRYRQLLRAGRVHASGRLAFGRRVAGRAAPDPGASAPDALPAAYVLELKANRAAWAWLQSRTPAYRRTVMRWVMDAKREETRLRRLATLIADSAAGRPIAPRARAPRTP